MVKYFNKSWFGDRLIFRGNIGEPVGVGFVVYIFDLRFEIAWDLRAGFRSFYIGFSVGDL